MEQAGPSRVAHNILHQSNPIIHEPARGSEALPVCTHDRHDRRLTVTANYMCDTGLLNKEHDEVFENTNK